MGELATSRLSLPIGQALGTRPISIFFVREGSFGTVILEPSCDPGRPIPRLALRPVWYVAGASLGRPEEAQAQLGNAGNYNSYAHEEWRDYDANA